MLIMTDEKEAVSLEELNKALPFGLTPFGIISGLMSAGGMVASYLQQKKTNEWQAEVIRRLSQIQRGISELKNEIVEAQKRIIQEFAGLYLSEILPVVDLYARIQVEQRFPSTSGAQAAADLETKLYTALLEAKASNHAYNPVVAAGYVTGVYYQRDLLYLRTQDPKLNEAELEGMRQGAIITFKNHHQHILSLQEEINKRVEVAEQEVTKRESDIQQDDNKYLNQFSYTRKTSVPGGIRIYLYLTKVSNFPDRGINRDHYVFTGIKHINVYSTVRTYQHGVNATAEEVQAQFKRHGVWKDYTDFIVPRNERFFELKQWQNTLHLLRELNASLNALAGDLRKLIEDPYHNHIEVPEQSADVDQRPLWQDKIASVAKAAVVTDLFKHKHVDEAIPSAATNPKSATHSRLTSKL